MNDQTFDDTDVARGTEIVSPRAREAWELVVVVGGVRHEHSLNAPCEVTLGREITNVVPIEHASVSRRHARIQLSEGATIEDLGSSNGTRLDGRLLEVGKSAYLRTGSLVELGDVLILLRPPDGKAGVSEDVQRGVSGDMALALELADGASRASLGVFLVGPSGSGKRWVAERIHRQSPRAKLPFVALRVSADTAVDELLGTSAASPGVLERAQSGVVLLQGVETLSRLLQQGLERVLSTGKIVRGDNSETVMLARVFCASNDNPAELRRKGSFDSTLLSRLSGITIEIPPLARRRGEVKHLVETIVSESSQRGLSITDGALGQLLVYDWPENVRELREVLTRAATTARGTAITSEDLALGGKAPRPAGTDGAADAEKKRILVALDLCAGNQTKAAKMLGISRRTLINRLEDMNLPRPRKLSD
jgi:two-component system, NtrC family, response regulator AtoC